MSLRSELWQYYKDRRDGDPNWKKTGTQIWNITLGMLGKKDAPNLKSKAAEASGMLLFVVATLERHLPTVTDPVKILKGKLLLAAGQAALSFDHILKENKACRNIPYKISEQLFKGYMRFLTFYERAGGNLTPKCHLMFHIVQKTLQKGNPRFYATYHDESFNGIIARIARSVHRTHWSETVLRKSTLLFALTSNHD